MEKKTVTLEQLETALAKVKEYVDSKTNTGN